MCDFFSGVHTVLQHSDPSKKKNCDDFEGIPVLFLKSRKSNRNGVFRLYALWLMCKTRQHHCTRVISYSSP